MFALTVASGPQDLWAQAPIAARQSFMEVWAKRPVVTKKALYSIAYDSPSGQAVTVVSPDKSTFFQIQLISSGAAGLKLSAPIVDRDPKRLLDKVAAQLGATFSPKLLTFKAGTRFTARARFENLKEWGDERTQLFIDLYDDLEPDSIATQVKVQWPEPFSEDFSEREKVEALIAEFLQPPAMK